MYKYNSKPCNHMENTLDTMKALLSKNYVHKFGAKTHTQCNITYDARHSGNPLLSKHSGSVLFSCEDYLHAAHPTLTKIPPKSAQIITSRHDRAYVNFVRRNKNASHYTKEDGSQLSRITHNHAD